MRLVQRHLLIDGYNIIHAWKDLKAMLLRGEVEVATNQLLDRVRIIHDVEEIRLTIVFDGKGEQAEIVRPTDELSLSLLYSPSGVSADTIIEQIVLNSKKPELIVVASQDRFILQTVFSQGGSTLSAKELIAWVHSCEKRQKNKLENRKKSIDTQWKDDSPWDCI